MTKTVEKKQEVKAEQEKKETTLKQVFAMWKKTSQKGTTYFTGNIYKTELKGFYVTKKKNPKEPDVKIYKVIEDELSQEPILSLWCNVKSF